MGEKIEVIDYVKRYGFRIIYRDKTELDAIHKFTKFIVYYVIENDKLYYVTTNKKIGLFEELEDYGLDPFSGHGIDYLEKDYQIAYHDERDKCIFTETLFKKFCNSGEYSIKTEKKSNYFSEKERLNLY